MITLNELSVGEYAEVLKIETEKEVLERLKMLGIVVGSQVRMLKKTFFGNTFLVETDGVRIGMRKNPASKIFVERGVRE